LYKDNVIAGYSNCGGVKSAGSMVIIYRDHVSSDSTFELKWHAYSSGMLYGSASFWGYKIYAGSSYNFIEG